MPVRSRYRPPFSLPQNNRATIVAGLVVIILVKVLLTLLGGPHPPPAY